MSAHFASMDQPAKPRLSLRAEFAPAPTYWLCQTVREKGRIYVAATPIAKATRYQNTTEVTKAARFPTRESAEQHRPIGDANGGEPFAFDDFGKLLRFEPNCWQSAEAPLLAFDAPPEPPCADCTGTTFRHAIGCVTLKARLAQRTSVT